MSGPSHASSDGPGTLLAARTQRRLAAVVCSFVIDKALGTECGRHSRWWVRYRVGSGHYLHDKPLARCELHLSKTVVALSRPSNPLDQILDSVVPAGTVG